MPFCTQCGAENPASARYCDQCGSELVPVPLDAPSSAAPVPAASSTAAGPTVCPQCGTAVIPGEAFCDNCGAELLATGTPAGNAPDVLSPTGGELAPQPIYPPPQPVGPPVPPVPPVPPAPVPVPPVSPAPVPVPPTPVPTPPVPPVPSRTTLAPACIHLQDASTPIPLPSRDQALVGRADPMSNFFPDVDLSTYGALQRGVGRRHIRLFVENNQVFVEDLNSTNGTLLNRQKLTARVPYPVQDGDELRLGNMVLRIYL